MQSLGDGPPVVLIHGLLVGSLAEWYFTLAPVLAEKQQVILYDLRGHGRSERCLDGYDLKSQRDDLESLLHALDVSGPVDLVGHSWGALVALHFCMAWPQRVRRLVLVEAPLPPTLMTDWRALDHKDVADIVANLPEQLQSALASGGRRSRKFLEGLQFLVTESSLMRDLAGEGDVTDQELSTIRLDTLCIFGQSSTCLPAGERLAAILPNARLEVIEGGHFLPIEQPKVLSSLIGAFLHG